MKSESTKHWKCFVGHCMPYVYDNCSDVQHSTGLVFPEKHIQSLQSLVVYRLAVFQLILSVTREDTINCFGYFHNWNYIFW
jgi:hypothetical protein